MYFLGFVLSLKRVSITLHVCNDKTMKSIRYNIILLLLALCMVNVRADIINDEVFHFVTKEDGLSGESVSRVMPDHIGRMWIATSDGVSLYNGKRMITFKMTGDGTHPNYVYDICEDESHNIYVATAQGIFEKKTSDKEFRHILKDIAKGEAILVSNGRIYVGNREGLHVYDGKKSQVVTVGASRMGVENGVRDIQADDKGNIWFLSRYALNCYFPETGKFKSDIIADKMTKGAALSHMTMCRGKFLIGTKNNGLFVYDPIKRDAPRQIDGVGNVITTVQTTSMGDVAVSTDGSGAFLIDGKTLQVKEVYNMNGDRKHRLPSDAVYCFTKDKHGVNWFGFYRFGLCHTYYSAPVFRRYSFDDFTTEGLIVRSFFIGNKVKLIGTNVGLYYIDESRHLVKLITPEMLEGGHIITNIIFYRGQYYIATYDAGLFVFNPKTFAVTRIPNEPLLTTTTVSSFTVSPDDKLWIGTGEGIFVLGSEGHVTRYTENNSRLCGGVVTGIMFDKTGNGWVGSQGLSLYVGATKTFENTHFPKGFFNGVTNLGCIRGHDDLIYFIRQSNVYYTNPSMSKFGQLELPDELQNTTCYSFLDDMRGSYWFATDGGLYRTDYQMKNLQHFGYGEGMMCQYINSNGVQMDADGTVWIGTSNGLMRADNKAMQRWQHNTEYHISLYNVRKGGDLVAYDEEDGINTDRNINISWNITSQKLSFRAVLLDYARQSGRLYQWRRDSEAGWHSVNDVTDIELYGLMPGVHNFQVRLAGAPGTESSYRIVVLPSALAIMEMLLLIVAIVLLLSWRRYHKNTKALLSERDEIEGALMEVERAQQNAEMQIQQLKEGNDSSAQTEETATQGQQGKYSRVRIDEAECAEIVARMKAYIDEKRPYINPELKMSDIAEVLHLSSSRLSQVFSLYLGENYYEFINGYRLREFKRLIADGAYNKYTLTALSEQCGFKKSSFFSTFRRVEGMTPTEYLKKQNIQL